jgi:uncharacterized membrane protein YiaA
LEKERGERQDAFIKVFKNYFQGVVHFEDIYILINIHNSMNRYIIPKIFCAVGTLIIFVGVFFSALNITLGGYFISFLVAVVITAILLLFAVLAFNMKTAHKKKIRKTIKCRTVEIISLVLFTVSGLASLLIFNHCITVWQRTSEIQTNLNIRQLEKMLPAYENYANQRIEKYKTQLDEATLYRSARTQKLTDLSFDTKSVEALESQKLRKVGKLEQVVRPHTYKELTDTINVNIAKFINIVEEFSPITAPKNITRIEEWARHYEQQLNSFSQYKMKGEDADDFHFDSTFGNVKDILTNYMDYFSPKRFTGYLAGIIALICMLFPYFWGHRSIKITKTKHSN